MKIEVGKEYTDKASIRVVVISVCTPGATARGELTSALGVDKMVVYKRIDESFSDHFALTETEFEKRFLWNVLPPKVERWCWMSFDGVLSLYSQEADARYAARYYGGYFQKVVFDPATMERIIEKGPPTNG